MLCIAATLYNEGSALSFAEGFRMYIFYAFGNRYGFDAAVAYRTCSNSYGSLSYRKGIAYDIARRTDKPVTDILRAVSGDLYQGVAAFKCRCV